MRQGDRASDQTSERVRTTQTDKQQHRPEPDHRLREPGKRTSRAERSRTRQPQHFPVGRQTSGPVRVGHHTVLAGNDDRTRVTNHEGGRNAGSG